MLGRFESMLSRLRRGLSRSVWLARLLRLPVSTGTASRPGLLMIQIDGLSQPELEHALRKGEMPFLKRLLEQGQYRLHAHYSGLPSTTPAVQAELFYGTTGAVPAFAFRQASSGQVIRMYEPNAAARVESLHDKNSNVPLLRDGSAYLDTFTGGAAEPHFCPSSMGWGPALRAANPLVVLAFVLTNFYSFLRVAVLLIVEFGLALGDLLRGLLTGYDFIKELKFVPSRVGISILLRELCVIGGKIDLSRGLPIIHINFIGYDEQSHRRGPHSKFAHWSLKGIDGAVARLWRAAHRSARRDYEVWLYSDHGQAQVRPHAKVHGRPLEDVLNAAFKKLDVQTVAVRADGTPGVQTRRVRLLGGNKIQRLFSVVGMNGERADAQRAIIAALGPVGHVYLPESVDRDTRDALAKELARTHAIPVVLTSERSGVIRAHTDAGLYRLPRDCATLFGDDHPFLDSLGEDLVGLVEHSEAGDLVLLGWRAGRPPVTFATENGAHAGVSPAETNAFALLPANTPLEGLDRSYLRPADLRRAALKHLGRADHGESSSRGDSQRLRD